MTKGDCALKKFVAGIVGMNLAAVLLTHNLAMAAEQQQIQVGFNQVSIKVNDQPFQSNSMLYDGTTYVPIRDVAAMLGLAVNYYDKNKTAYIGQIGAGEFSEDNHDIDSWDILTPATPSNDPIIEPQDATINVHLNEIKIQVHGTKVESDNILYNGTTFVPLRAVSESIEVPVNYDAETRTAYIGETSHTFPPADTAQDNSAAPSHGMYAVPAEGEMEGWQLLKGHEYENVANIYFMQNGSILSAKLEPIQTEDLNQIIEWTDETGKTRKNRLGDIYKMFGTFSNQYTDDYLYQTFGDLYINWLEPSTIDPYRLINQYLNGK